MEIAKGLVVIGASSGGPPALAAILDKIPEDFPAAIVIVQHIDKKFAGGMAEWLGKHTKWPVRLIQENDRVQPGVIWLAGTQDHVILKEHSRLGYVEDPLDNAYRPSVDVFFQSVSKLWRGRVVGVLLTGMGHDGALGLKMLRNKGHHTIAQDAASSAVYGMPKAAALLDAAIDILPLSRIAPRILEVFRL